MKGRGGKAEQVSEGGEYGGYRQWDRILVFVYVCVGVGKGGWRRKKKKKEEEGRIVAKSVENWARKKEKAGAETQTQQLQHTP
jgi:hypothetical protein